VEDGFVVGGEIDRVQVSLRIAGDTLVPDRLTRMLGVEPTFAAAKGETVERSGVPIRQRTGMWSYELPASTEWELSDAIKTLLEQLPADPALWESLAADYRMDLFCGVFLEASNRGTELSLDTMALLVERRLPLGLDIYALGS
jgi:hypothetical protein